LLISTSLTLDSRSLGYVLDTGRNFIVGFEVRGVDPVLCICGHLCDRACLCPCDRDRDRGVAVVGDVVVTGTWPKRGRDVAVSVTVPVSIPVCLCSCLYACVSVPVSMCLRAYACTHLTVPMVVTVTEDVAETGDVDPGIYTYSVPMPVYLCLYLYLCLYVRVCVCTVYGCEHEHCRSREEIS
jgi:hypothetical protein